MEEVHILYPQTKEFLYQIYLPIMGWLAAVVVLLVLFLKKYTFGNWTPEKPNPYEKKTWGMPEGTLRGIITMTLLYVVVVLETVNVKDSGFEARADMLLVAFQMMIAFYFGSKVMHHVTSVDGQKAQTKIETHASAQSANSQSAIPQGLTSTPTTTSEDEEPAG